MSKRLHTLRKLTALSLGSVLSLSAAAQQDSFNYWGAGVGSMRAKPNEAATANNLLGAAAGATVLTTDRKDTSAKFFFGHQFNRMLAVEAGYFDLGDAAFTATTATAQTLNGRLRAKGVNLDLLGMLPVTDSWSVFGRVGATYARVQDSFSGTAVAASGVDSRNKKANAKAGLGLQVDLGSSLIARAEVERYRINGAVSGRTNVDNVSFSLLFPFGRGQRATPRAAMAPAVQMAAAPAPAPMPMPAPPLVIVQAAPVQPPPPAVVVPERRRVSFAAHSLFAFDNADVREEGKAELDGFAKELQTTRFDSISVEGHTDRLGSLAHNQALSQQRADAVKAHLVSVGRVDPGKISSQGKGELSPVTKPEDCKGNAATAKLVACLQPDRRVDIEVSGTR
jgi:OmpA-OmpF porin, OOP family